MNFILSLVGNIIPALRTEAVVTAISFIGYLATPSKETWSNVMMPCWMASTSCKGNRPHYQERLTLSLISGVLPENF